MQGYAEICRDIYIHPDIRTVCLTVQTSVLERLLRAFSSSSQPAEPDCPSVGEGSMEEGVEGQDEGVEGQYGGVEGQDGGVEGTRWRCGEDKMEVWRGQDGGVKEQDGMHRAENMYKGL